VIVRGMANFLSVAFEETERHFVAHRVGDVRAERLRIGFRVVLFRVLKLVLKRGRLGIDILFVGDLGENETDFGAIISGVFP
jgi:hypothetical protein